MATRSAVLIESMSGRVALYRHWDGNLAEAGADLALACAGAACAEEILAALLQHRYREDRLVYELMDTPDDSGDLEHCYLVQYVCGDHGFARHYCGSGAALSIQHAERTRTTETSVWRDWPRRTYTLAGFVEAVNADRRRVNEYLAHRRRDGDGWAIEAADYEMLSVPA